MFYKLLSQNQSFKSISQKRVQITASKCRVCQKSNEFPHKVSGMKTRDPQVYIINHKNSVPILSSFSSQYFIWDATIVTFISESYELYQLHDKYVYAELKILVKQHIIYGHAQNYAISNRQEARSITIQFHLYCSLITTCYQNQAVTHMSSMYIDSSATDVVTQITSWCDRKQFPVIIRTLWFIEILQHYRKHNQ